MLYMKHALLERSKLHECRLYTKITARRELSDDFPGFYVTMLRQLIILLVSM